MREAAIWTYLDTHLPPWLAMERFEFRHPPGGSDCHWVDQRFKNGHAIAGWLELKYEDKLPGSYRLSTLKPEQPQFLCRQARRDVPSGILLREGIFAWKLWVASPHREWCPEILLGLVPDAQWLAQSFDVAQMIDTLEHIHRKKFNTPYKPVSRHGD